MTTGSGATSEPTAESTVEPTGGTGGGGAPVLIGSAELERLTAAALRRAGATAADAAVQAGHLVEGELRGHASHGVRRLAVLCERLRAGLLVSGRPPTLTWAASGALDVDGHYGFGPVNAHVALGELLPRAATTGIAVATLRHNHHLGMLSPYIERMAAEGFIGIILTTTEAGVHPWGGAAALIGTNPIAIGVPSGGSPLVLDMSTAAIPRGKVLDFAARGEALPPGVAVDADGAATTDATAAASGSISPFGGAKGYALGIAFGAVVGLLTRSAYGTDVRGMLDAEHINTKGDILVAIDPRAFGAATDDVALASYFDLIRASAPEGSTVSIPGDRARSLRQERRRDGIPVDPHVLGAVRALAGGGDGAGDDQVS